MNKDDAGEQTIVQYERAIAAFHAAVAALAKLGVPLHRMVALTHNAHAKAETSAIEGELGRVRGA